MAVVSGAAEVTLAAVFVVADFLAVVVCCDCTFVVALEVVVVAAVMVVVGVMVVWGVETWLQLEVEIGVECDVREDVLRDGLHTIVQLSNVVLLLSSTNQRV